MSSTRSASKLSHPLSNLEHLSQVTFMMQAVPYHAGNSTVKLTILVLSGSRRISSKIPTTWSTPLLRWKIPSVWNLNINRGHFRNIFYSLLEKVACTTRDSAPGSARVPQNVPLTHLNPKFSDKRTLRINLYYALTTIFVTGESNRTTRNNLSALVELVKTVNS